MAAMEKSFSKKPPSGDYLDISDHSSAHESDLDLNWFQWPCGKKKDSSSRLKEKPTTSQNSAPTKPSKVKRTSDTKSQKTQEIIISENGKGEKKDAKKKKGKRDSVSARKSDKKEDIDIEKKLKKIYTEKEDKEESRLSKQIKRLSKMSKGSILAAIKRASELIKPRESKKEKPEVSLLEDEPKSSIPNKSVQSSPASPDDKKSVRMPLVTLPESIQLKKQGLMGKSEVQETSILKEESKDQKIVKEEETQKKSSLKKPKKDPEELSVVEEDRKTEKLLAPIDQKAAKEKDSTVKEPKPEEKSRKVKEEKLTKEDTKIHEPPSTSKTLHEDKPLLAAIPEAISLKAKQEEKNDLKDNDLRAESSVENRESFNEIVLKEDNLERNTSSVESASKEQKPAEGSQTREKSSEEKGKKSEDPQGKQTKGEDKAGNIKDKVSEKEGGMLKLIPLKPSVSAVELESVKKPEHVFRVQPLIDESKPKEGGSNMGQSREKEGFEKSDKETGLKGLIEKPVGESGEIKNGTFNEQPLPGREDKADKSEPNRSAVGVKTEAKQGADSRLDKPYQEKEIQQEKSSGKNSDFEEINLIHPDKIKKERISGQDNEDLKPFDSAKGKTSGPESVQVEKSKQERLPIQPGDIKKERFSGQDDKGKKPLDDTKGDRATSQWKPKGEQKSQETQTDLPENYDVKVEIDSSATSKTIGIQTSPHRFDYFDENSDKVLLPTGVLDDFPEGKLAAKSVQTDCICNSDTSIQKMNKFEKCRAARSGSSKENKACQTDICMCNYYETASSDENDEQPLQ